MTIKPRTQRKNGATSVAAKSKGKSPKAKGAKRTVFTAVKSHPILTAAGALALGVGAYALTKGGSKPAAKKASARGRRKSS